MRDTTIVRAAQEAAYHRLLWRYEQLDSLLDDRGFVRESSCLMAEIHASLLMGDLPHDLVTHYRQLEQRTRARVAQRQMLPGRPLF